MCAAETASTTIDICAENPRYWRYDGRPVLLLGGSDEDNLFQLPNVVEQLDTLAACGGNYVRCTMSSRDEGNVWPFAREGGTYDLDRWNDEYWRRFTMFLEETERRGVIVQIELWATFDFYRDNWERNPFNPRNNCTYTAEEAGLPTAVPTHPVKTENNFFWSVPAENNQQRVLKYQRKFVDKLLSHALEHGNVLYCMDNETSVTPEWGKYWSEHVRGAARRAGRIVHTTEMWDPWDLDHPMHRATLDHPETYTFADISQNNHNNGQEHYDNALGIHQRVAEAPRPLTCVKTYGADGGRFGTTRDGVERFWRNVFAGISAVRFHRPGSGIGLNEEAQRMIRAAREVTGAFDIFRCAPCPDLLSERAPDEAYCLADPGREYALYFPDGGEVALNTTGAQRELSLRWYDVERGQWADEEAVQGGGRAQLRCPADGQWAAVLR